ncbi:MAG: RNA polymerase sigma factor [Oscillospiraceae bacterium]
MVCSEEEKNKIYTDFHKKVTRYVTGKIPNPQDAEDLVSCVFMKVFQKLDTFDESKASLSTWIFTITRNTVYDFYGTRKDFSELPEELSTDSNIDENLLNEEMLEQLADALESLDERSRDLIILHYYDGLTLKEIADRMQMSYPNAKVIHKKALHALQAVLGDLN